MKSILCILSILILGSSCAHRVEVTKNRLSGAYRHEVGDIVKLNGGKFKACYRDGFQKNKVAPVGKVVLDWQINRDGLPQNIQVNEMSSTLRGLELEECLRAELSFLSFPAPPKGVVVQVNSYPLEFSVQ